MKERKPNWHCGTISLSYIVISGSLQCVLCSLEGCLADLSRLQAKLHEHLLKVVFTCRAYSPLKKKRKMKKQFSWSEHGALYLNIVLYKLNLPTIFSSLFIFRMVCKEDVHGIHIHVCVCWRLCFTPHGAVMYSFLMCIMSPHHEGAHLHTTKLHTAG